MRQITTAARGGVVAMGGGSGDEAVGVVRGVGGNVAVVGRSGSGWRGVVVMGCSGGVVVGR